jgi:hypothetical protein
MLGWIQVESHWTQTMRINWVVSSTYQLDPAVDADAIKNVGPVWGSWKTWRSCATDNVICHEASRAQDLVDRNFQKNCNFYIHETNFVKLGRPPGCRVYGGDFLLEVDEIEDIIALHLAAAQSDIVILMGFKLTGIAGIDDVFELHKKKNYHGLVRGVISAHPETQWVLVDHAEKLDKSYQDLANLTCDTFNNVLQLLAQ